jgi:hypothetical protein
MSASCRPTGARGRAVDHRSDLYSIGLVILHAATGEQTYPGDTFYDLLTAAADRAGRRDAARIAALPAPLPAIVTRALEVDPTSGSSPAPSSAPPSRLI